MAPSDATLLQQWRHNADPDAFAQLVKRHSAMVYATARRILADPASAQDVTQECFLRLGAVSRVKGDSLRGLLHAMAVHRALNRLRSETRRREREIAYALQQPRAADFRPRDLQPHVDEAVAALPDKLRDPLIAHFFEGQTYTAIAAELAIDESTVRYRVKQALRHARRLLAQKGVTAPAATLTTALSTQANAALPPTLAKSLGAIGIAGPATVHAAHSVGGILMAKKLAFAVLALMLATAGYWTFSRESTPPSPGGTPAVIANLPDTQSAVPGMPQPGPNPEVPPSPPQPEPSPDPAADNLLLSLLADIQARQNAQPPHADSIRAEHLSPENGAHYFFLAAEALTEELNEHIHTVADLGPEAWIDPEFLAHWDEIQHILNLIRQGVALQNAQLPTPIHGPHEDLYYLAHWRFFGRLFSVEASLLQAQGDYRGALDSLLTATEFASQFHRGGTLIGGANSYRLMAEFTEHLRGAIDGGLIPPDAYPYLTSELQRLAGGIPTNQDLHYNEMMSIDMWLVDQIQHTNDIRGTFAEVFAGYSDELQATLQGMTDAELEYHFSSFLQDRQILAEYAERPVYEMDNAELDAILGNNPISRAFLPPNTGLAMAEARTRVYVHGTALMAAIEHYARDHGEYPSSLNDLTPTYLSQVPPDPFTGRPFGYQNSGGGYLLYSAGHNGVDNGGVQSENLRAPGADIVLRAPRLP